MATSTTIKVDSQQTFAAQKADDLLSGPIVSVMLKLAFPTLCVLVIQTLIGVIETYFVSSLGAHVLAGVSVVFPVLMLMQMMANGGIGNGLASAIARAYGAQKWELARSLVWHGIILAGIIGVFFALILIILGPTLYKSMGVSEEALSAALSYSNIVFISSPLIWLVAMLSAALRGAGDTRTPALITLLGALILLPLSPALIFGWGVIPAQGVAGAGLAIVIYYVITALFLTRHLISDKSVIKASISPPNLKSFKDILGVGLLASLGTVQLNLTVAIVTAAVGYFGADAVAGYGIASRLEYIQIPLLFGLGTAIITMVGVNIGAGQVERARKITWIGALIAFTFTTIIGLIVAIYPNLWLTIFTDDENVLNFGANYLQKVAPLYGFISAGLIIYFAGIGMKRVFWPVLAGTVRMIIAAIIGWISVFYFNSDLPLLFNIIVISILAYFLISITSMRVIFR